MADAYESKAIPALSRPTQNDRLSIAAPRRVALMTAWGFGSGAVLGMIHGSQIAGLRFRAENAHRLPKDTKGWYFYHKAKNYYAMSAGLKEGSLTGLRLGFWTMTFFTLEGVTDTIRGNRRDFLSTTMAGLSTSAIFSLTHRLPLETAARMIRMGIATGLAFGVLQDLLSLARGRRLAYIDFFTRPGRESDNGQQSSDAG